MERQEERNLVVVKKIYEKVAQGAWEEVKGYLHDDMMSYEAASLPYGGSYRGGDGFERLVNTMYSAWEDVDFRVEEFTAGGDCVIVLLHFAAKGKKTGKTLAFPMAELWRFRDGKVIELRPFYFDTKRASEVFGD